MVGAFVGELEKASKARGVLRWGLVGRGHDAILAVVFQLEGFAPRMAPLALGCFLGC